MFADYAKLYEKLEKEVRKWNDIKLAKMAGILGHNPSEKKVKTYNAKMRTISEKCGELKIQIEQFKN